MSGFYKNKRVFVTGHNGFKGATLCHMLQEAGAELYGYALPPLEVSLYNALKLDISQTLGDVRNMDSLCAAVKAFRPEIVFHMAAQPIVRESYKSPAYTYGVNVMGTVALLEAVRATNSVRSVVNVTTDKVYQNNEWLWGYRENERLCSDDPYSNSKSCSELVTHSYIKSFIKDIPVSTARSGNVIGYGDTAKDRIIPDCVRAARVKRPIVVRNASSVRPYMHVKDTLRGYMILAQMQYAQPELAGAYNFAPKDSDIVTTGKLVDLFCKAWKGATWKEEREENAPHEANYLKLDASKAHAVLGWHTEFSIVSAIEDIVEREQNDNYFSALTE